MTVEQFIQQSAQAANHIRTIEGCLKNSYHVTALHNAGDCNECLGLLTEGYMKIFNIKSHVDFGDNK